MSKHYRENFQIVSYSSKLNTKLVFIDELIILHKLFLNMISYINGLINLLLYAVLNTSTQIRKIC